MRWCLGFLAGMLLGGASPLHGQTTDAAADASTAIVVRDEVVFDQIDCFRVETSTATYVLGKKGAGIVSIFDADGRDWIGYKPEGKAKGEYRGMPKCGQPVKFFHCGYSYGQYPTENVFVTQVTEQSAQRVRIDSVTRDGKSACYWVFEPTRATFTITRIDRPTFWFLYEGTPGGVLDPQDDYVIRPDGTKTTLDTPWSQVVPWVCFGCKESKRGFWCRNHQRPEEGQTDSYVSWPFEREADGGLYDMTVFGFGRKGYKELIEHIPDLKQLPATFSVGFVEEVSVEGVTKAIGE
jgi:hypothetical protein